MTFPFQTTVFHRLEAATCIWVFGVERVFTICSRQVTEPFEKKRSEFFLFSYHFLETHGLNC